MSQPRSQWLTTGQAARFCSVKADTVLKWIKKGRLPAIRTVGGHYRVERRSLEGMVSRAGPVQLPALASAEPRRQPLRCWEYLSEGGALREECRKCIVYQARVSWCFQLAGMQAEIGHARSFCGTSCQECTYYRRVKGLSTHVLVVTCDQELIGQLAEEDNEGITLRFARNTYEASAVISEFRPAFVVLDQDLMAAHPELVEYLARDPRIPGAKIILGVSRGQAGPERGWSRLRSITGIIEKPFGHRRIAAVINDFPVESVALGNTG